MVISVIRRAQATTAFWWWWYIVWQKSTLLSSLFSVEKEKAVTGARQSPFPRKQAQQPVRVYADDIVDPMVVVVAAATTVEQVTIAVAVATTAPCWRAPGPRISFYLLLMACRPTGAVQSTDNKNRLPVYYLLPHTADPTPTEYPV